MNLPFNPMEAVQLLDKILGTNHPLRQSWKETYLVQTNLYVQPYKLLIWLHDVDQGSAGGVEGGICKIVIRSGRLSVKLPNPHAPL
jgi:hypothetical protein